MSDSIKVKVDNFLQRQDVNWEFLDTSKYLADSYDANVLWIDMKIKVDQSLLQRLPRLEFIVSPTTGLTHVDTTALLKRGIEIISLRGDSLFLKDISASSEFAWTLVLSTWRKLPLIFQNINTSVSEREKFTSLQLNKRTIGIIGFGRIGRNLCRYANAMGMNVLYYDKYFTTFADELESNNQGTSLKSIDAVCEAADVLVVAASHIEEDADFYPLIGEEEISKMRADSILVNISRGSLIDEKAVARNIRSGRLKGFATDVLSMEEVNHHEIESPLLSLMSEGYNVVISPHVGGMCLDALLECQARVATKLVERVRIKYGV